MHGKLFTTLLITLSLISVALVDSAVATLIALPLRLKAITQPTILTSKIVPEPRNAIASGVIKLLLPSEFL